jgi:hypothetical protein
MERHDFLSDGTMMWRETVKSAETGAPNVEVFLLTASVYGNKFHEIPRKTTGRRI